MTVRCFEEVLERKCAVVQIRLHPAPGYLETWKGVCLCDLGAAYSLGRFRRAEDV